MMHSETDEVFKMNGHHAPLRKIVVEIRLEKK
jgi:7-keto-8-aminopelargonate synthetase-like enzyme